MCVCVPGTGEWVSDGDVVQTSLARFEQYLIDASRVFGNVTLVHHCRGVAHCSTDV